MDLLPEQDVPFLQIETVNDGIWQLQKNVPEQLTMIVFYRGLHCPICKEYLSSLRGHLDAFQAEGVDVIAISSDSKERAEKTVEEWELEGLPVGCEFPIEEAEEWGLFVSEHIDNKDADVEEPEQFTEPAIFLVKPDGKLYASSIQTMPFARPKFEDILKAVQFVRENDYPARGQAIAA